MAGSLSHYRMSGGKESGQEDNEAKTGSPTC